MLAFVALETRGLNVGDYAAFVGSLKELPKLPASKDLPASLGPLRERLNHPGVIAAAEQEIARLEKAGIGMMVLGSAEYPSSLVHLYEPPPLLFYKGGDPALLRDKICVSIVGARKADQIGCDVAYDFALQVAEAEGVVVSGLAYGIDAHAHLGALRAERSATTAAVLGNGLEFGIYPCAHKKIAQDILDSGGMLISQFPSTMKPFPSNFLDRNRVIAALSRATLIVQAAERSGALATARHAMELGREVLVVPGAIGDPRYVGSNRLIKQGAYLVSEIADLFALVPELVMPGNGGRIAPPVALSDLQLEIQKQLIAAPTIHYDELLRNHADAGALAQAIEGLEDAKLITRLPGNFIATRVKV